MRMSFSAVLITSFFVVGEPTKMVNFTEFMNCTVGNASIEYAHCLDDVPPYENCPDPTVCEDADGGGNVGLAFGLTIGAGLATTLGALLPFVPFIKQRNTRFLAASMALAAGVMLYVSFTDIRTKSLNNFCCVSLDHYEILTASCFFGGIILTAALDALVSLLQKMDCGFSTGKLKRVRFSMKGDSGGGRKVSGREKVRVHVVNSNGVVEDMERLDSSALIQPHRLSGAETTSQSTTPTANSVEEGCDVALEVEEEEGDAGGAERKARTAETRDEEQSSVAQTLTGGGVGVGYMSGHNVVDVVCCDVNSHLC